MRRSRRLLAATLIVVVAAGVTVAVVKAGRIKRAAALVADDIEHQLQELDPVTRAAVVGKLSTDAVKDVRARH